MQTRIDPSWLTRPETLAVLDALRRRDIVARAVGGAVRNALIGKAASDIDLATPALPQVTIAAAEAAGLTVVPTGLAHGTVTIMSGGIPYEVTTLRRDVETDGRHAVVTFTADWAADAARRDFTINALYCDADGTVHDPLGCGLTDLAERRVRFIGDPEARISEDHLRILRFFRFTAEYGAGALDSAGLLACSRCRAGLETLSAERIRSELLKLLVAPRAGDVVDAMFDHGYWPALLGNVPWPAHVERLIDMDHATQNPGHALQRLACLAVLTDDDAHRLALRLRLSRADEHLLVSIATLRPQIDTRPSNHQVRLLLYRHGRQALALAVAIASARHGAPWHRLAERVAAEPFPVFPVRGQDLIDRGHLPGRGIGIELGRLERAWIASDFASTREQLLNLPV